MAPTYLNELLQGRMIRVDQTNIRVESQTIRVRLDQINTFVLEWAAHQGRMIRLGSAFYPTKMAQDRYDQNGTSVLEWAVHQGHMICLGSALHPTKMAQNRLISGVKYIYIVRIRQYECWLRGRFVMCKGVSDPKHELWLTA